MILLLPLLGLGVVLYLWLSRRGSTLTRDCRWRQHRAEALWRCAACGAECRPPKGEPRHCLRGDPQPTSGPGFH